MEERTVGEESPTVEEMEARVDRMLDKAIVGAESVSAEDAARVKELVEASLDRGGHGALFTVVSNPNGEGFVSRFYFEAIDSAATGPVRATAEECVPDCMKALKGLLGQLGIDPSNARVVVARVETFT